MFVTFDDNVHVLVDKREIALLRAEHIRLYPAGREACWFWFTTSGRVDWTPEEILDYEIAWVMDEFNAWTLCTWAQEYLDWDEVPKLWDAPHYDEDWTNLNFGWKHVVA